MKPPQLRFVPASLSLGTALLIGATVVGGVGAAATDSSAARLPGEGVVSQSLSQAVDFPQECRLFPRKNYWNTRIDKLPLHRRSKAWTGAIGDSGSLHPDFGPSFGEQSEPYGIPLTVVDGSHARVPVSFYYDDESDRVRYPLGTGTRIEGGLESDGDRHAIVVDRDSCTLFETYDTRPAGGAWEAGSGAVWSLRSNTLRPEGWTSADAAGLPILPGLLRYEEVASGSVRHAIRFTAPRTRKQYIWPARHFASSDTSSALPPMGARFRLARNFSLQGWSPQARIVLRAMKRYGLVLADNGSPWYFQGTADSRWPIDLVDELKAIPASAFEAVRSQKLRISSESARARQLRR